MKDKYITEEEIRRYKRAQYRKKRRIRQRNRRVAIAIAAIVAVIGIMIMIVKGLSPETEAAGVLLQKEQGLRSTDFAEHPDWEEDFLTPNKYSRPGYPLQKVDNIFVHYVANPSTSAKQNRDYFEQLGQTGERSASAHFIIGLDGEIIQCVPLNEIAYAVKTRNYDSISIECCHPTEDGAFTQETYDSLIELLRWLLDIYNLDKDDVLRHYDSNGKLCPLYYVEHEDAWEQLKNNI